MSFLNSYKSYISSQGNDIASSLSNSSKDFVRRQMKNHPSYRVVNWKGVELDSRILKQKNTNGYTPRLSDQMTFLFLPDSEVRMGDVVELNEDKYIIYDANENDIYPTYYAIKANCILSIVVDSTKTIIGRTSLGEPIYSDPVNIYYEMPCYMSNQNGITYNTEFSKEIIIPAGRDIILAPYGDNIEQLIEGLTFEVFDSQYRIMNIDKGQMADQNGYYELFVERIQLSNK